MLHPAVLDRGYHPVKLGSVKTSHAEMEDGKLAFPFY